MARKKLTSSTQHPSADDCRRCRGIGYLAQDIKRGWRYTRHAVVCPVCGGTGKRFLPGGNRNG